MIPGTNEKLSSASTQEGQSLTAEGFVLGVAKTLLANTVQGVPAWLDGSDETFDDHYGDRQVCYWNYDGAGEIDYTWPARADTLGGGVVLGSLQTQISHDAGGRVAIVWLMYQDTSMITAFQSPYAIPPDDMHSRAIIQALGRHIELDAHKAIEPFGSASELLVGYKSLCRYWQEYDETRALER